MKKLFLSAVLSVVLPACSSHVSTVGELTSDGATIVSVPSSFSPIQSIMSLCSDFQVVSIIESEDRFLQNSVDGIAVAPDGFLVWDTHQRKAVFAISENGEVKNTIGRSGRGPGEFIQPDDVQVVDSTVLVFDSFGHKIMKYDLDGNFIESMSVAPNLKKIEFDGCSGTFFGVAGANISPSLESSEVIVLNSEGELVNSPLINEFSLNYSSGPMISSFGPTVYYHKPLSNRIISFDDGKPQVAYFLDFGADNLPADYEKRCGGDFEQFHKLFMSTSDYSYPSGYFILTQRFAIFGVNRRGVPCICVYDNVDAVSYLFEASLSSSSLNDSAQLLSFALARPLAVSGNTVYCHVDSFIASALNLNDTGSPVIVKIQFIS